MLFAIGFVLFLPQFYTPPAARIGHGVLVAASSIWLALAIWRTTRTAPRCGEARRDDGVASGLFTTGRTGV